MLLCRQPPCHPAPASSPSVSSPGIEPGTDAQRWSLWRGPCHPLHHRDLLVLVLRRTVAPGRAGLSGPARRWPGRRVAGPGIEPGAPALWEPARHLPSLQGCDPDGNRTRVGWHERLAARPASHRALVTRTGIEPVWASLKDSLQVQHRTAPRFVDSRAVTTGFEPARTDRQSIMLPGYITSPFVFPGPFSAPGGSRTGHRREAVGRGRSVGWRTVPSSVPDGI